MHKTARHLRIECRTFVQYRLSKLLLTISSKRHLDRVVIRLIVKLRNEQPCLVPRVVTLSAPRLVAVDFEDQIARAGAWVKKW